MNKQGVETLFTILLAVLLVTAYLGVMTKRMRDTFTSDVSLHRSAAYLALAFYLCSIGATEWMIRTHGGEVESIFFPIHLFFAVISLSSFLAALWFNGNRKREWHRMFVYTCLSTYIIAFILAIPLLKKF